MPEPLCCATIHATVRDCEVEGPVRGAVVTISGAGGVVASVVTDDTGTVTVLVGAEGDYNVRATYNDGTAAVDVEATCGINNVEVQFGLTDKICVLVLDPDGDPVSGYDVELTDDAAAVVGTCVTAGDGTCCVAIPGPGEYFVNGDEATTIVDEDDCGDRIVQVNTIGEAEPCERHVHVELCGCDAPGVTVEVEIPGVGTYSGVTDGDGDATISMTEPGCDAWIGATYTVLGTGVTGTISAEPHNIIDDTPDGHWCLGGPDPCFEEVPATLTAGFVGGFGGSPLSGTTTTLTQTGPWTWESGCLAHSGGNSVRLVMVINPAPTFPCLPYFSGTITWREYSGSGCTGTPFVENAFNLEPTVSTGCPVYFFFTGPGNQEIEVTP